jgi:hypothetical protein
MGTAKPAAWKEVQGTAGTEEVGCTEWERGTGKKETGGAGEVSRQRGCCRRWRTLCGAENPQG